MRQIKYLSEVFQINPQSLRTVSEYWARIWGQTPIPIVYAGISRHIRYFDLVLRVWGPYLNSELVFARASNILILPGVDYIPICESSSHYSLLVGCLLYACLKRNYHTLWVDTTPIALHVSHKRSSIKMSFYNEFAFSMTLSNKLILVTVVLLELITVSRQGLQVGRNIYLTRFKI